MALSYHFKQSHLAPKNFKFHPRVKKYHFGNFSEWAGMAVPCQVGPQESLTGIEKLFLFWMLIDIQKDWKLKLESAYSFMLKYSKITVWALCSRNFKPNSRYRYVVLCVLLVNIWKSESILVETMGHQIISSALADGRAGSTVWQELF